MAKQEINYAYISMNSPYINLQQIEAKKKATNFSPLRDKMVAFFFGLNIIINCYRELHSTSHRVDCFLENFVCLHPFFHEHLVTVVVSFACFSDSA